MLVSNWWFILYNDYWHIGQVQLSFVNFKILSYTILLRAKRYFSTDTFQDLFQYRKNNNIIFGKYVWRILYILYTINKRTSLLCSILIKNRIIFIHTRKNIYSRRVYKHMFYLKYDTNHHQLDQYQQTLEWSSRIVE